METETVYEIKRAIIVAAGIGERLQPVTLHTPKPLVPVNGTRMIDTIIRALHENGITEIYVVVGYLKEQFAYLEQTEGVTLIDNPYYDTCNNIASLYVAREHLEDVMILDGDQMISNPDILHPRFSRSGYNAVWTSEPTKEWLLRVNENGTVTHCSRDGGVDGYRLCSISRWSKEDGVKLRRHLETEFEEKQNRDIYWDDVALFCYPQEYRLGIFEMQAEDVLEIDEMDELIAIDGSYRETV